MEALKKFFDKKKTDVQFKKAGQGKKLTEASASSSSKRHEQTPQARVNPSSSAQRAGQAALERFSNKSTTEVNWSQHAIKAQAKRELEAERKLQELSVTSKPDAAAAPPQPIHPVQPVLFTSPLSEGEPDTYDAVKARIKEALFEQLHEEESKMVAACLIIHTCNKPKEKIQVCVDTLCKYLNNIVTHPTEEKYRRIRAGNQAFKDRVASVEGGVQLLRAVGFEEQLLPPQEDATPETFFVFADSGDVEHLKAAAECLQAAEPVRPVLHRSAVVLLPQQSMRQPDLPPEFFTLTKDELLREMQLRKDVVEESLMLRTKAMRERASAREMRKYRFSFIRVRFPDGLTLQGTFRTADKLAEVLEFVRAHLVNDWRPFQLYLSGGKKLGEDDLEKSLAELFLAPAALLNFSWDETVSDPQLDDSILLRPEVLEQLIQQPVSAES